MIEVQQINKSYGSLQVLRNVSCSIHKGEVVSIVGPSGAGKSTLLHIMGALDQADSGSIRFNGKELSTLDKRGRALFRNKNIGFVFQFHHLLPEFTALENICLPAFVRGFSKAAATKRANELLDKLDLTKRAAHFPGELSGGEQQRIAVARALVNQPDVILADEPSGNLDSQSAESLHKLFFDLRDEFGQTFIIVTHNRTLAAQTDRTLQMRDGELNLNS